MRERIRFEREMADLMPGADFENGAKRGPGAKPVVIIANGYQGFSNAADEIKAVKDGLWLPSTVDFKETAGGSFKNFHGASNAGEFFGALEAAAKKAPILRVIFIGHGNRPGLGLSGDSTSFFSETLTAHDLSKFQGNIDNAIKPRLAKDARIDLIACNQAISKDFMQALADAFGICVRGFPEEVMWCLGFSGNKITSRGRISPKSKYKAAKPKGCSDKVFSVKVGALVPPVKVCPTP